MKGITDDYEQQIEDWEDLVLAYELKQFAYVDELEKEVDHDLRFSSEHDETVRDYMRTQRMERERTRVNKRIDKVEQHLKWLKKDILLGVGLGIVMVALGIAIGKLTEEGE